MPKLNQLTDVGEVEVGTFSIEKVLALKPDLLVLAEWQYKALGSDLDRINKAGIPIVVLDYNAQTVAKHVQSTKLIGTLTGQQQKADKLAADYKRVADTIQARVQKANLPKPKVYVEFGNKGPAEHSVTFGKSMWGSMATLVGGNNIAASSVEFYGPINPEKVLARQTRCDRDYRPRNRIEEKSHRHGDGLGHSESGSGKTLGRLCQTRRLGQPACD